MGWKSKISQWEVKNNGAIEDMWGSLWGNYNDESCRYPNEIVWISEPKNFIDFHALLNFRKNVSKFFKLNPGRFVKTSVQMHVPQSSKSIRTKHAERSQGEKIPLNLIYPGLNCQLIQITAGFVWKSSIQTAPRSRSVNRLSEDSKVSRKWR